MPKYIKGDIRLVGRPGPANWLQRLLTGFVLAAVLAVTQAAEEPEDFQTLDSQTQSLKEEVLELNRDLFLLEEELLFPSSTQVSVFVSMDSGTLFGLDSVQLKIDDEVVSNYLYTERELEALRRGGVHRLYVGNLKAGEHELVALFVGKGPNGRDYKRGAETRFTKELGPRFMELRIVDSGSQQQPEFEVKQW